MLRVFVLCVILTASLVEPHFRRHCHNHPPFHRNPCSGVVDTDENTQQESSTEWPHRRHCHNHPPFHGNPCPGVVDTDQNTQEESGRGLPHKRHCHNSPPFHGNPCPGVVDTDQNNQLLLLINSGRGWPHRRHCRFCHGTTERPSSETLLQTIERELTEQEEKFVEFCKKYSRSNAKEMYGTDNYFLKYDLPEAATSNVRVQIKHKFIHTTLTKKDGAREKVFEDVKVVPDIANAESASWTLLNKKVLKITIPYKVPLGTEVAKDCGAVNNDVIDVLDVVPEFTFKSKD